MKILKLLESSYLYADAISDMLMVLLFKIQPMGFLFVFFKIILLIYKYV